MIIGLFFIFTIVVFLLISILYLHCDHKNFMFNLKILYAASIQLNFCLIHKYFIIYDSIASVWIDIKKILDPLIGIKINFVVITLGIILIIWLLVFLLKKKPGH